MSETVKNKDADKTPRSDGQGTSPELDRELADTFPASDPPSSTMREEKKSGTSEKAEN